MSKKDRAKSKLDMLRSLILGFMTALFGAGGYAFTHHKELTFWEAIIISVCMLFFISAILWCGYEYNKELNKLEKMK
ncbi:hypothetical protein [Helicobacter sp. T3_23-1056]